MRRVDCVGREVTPISPHDDIDPEKASDNIALGHTADYAPEGGKDVINNETTFLLDRNVLIRYVWINSYRTQFVAAYDMMTLTNDFKKSIHNIHRRAIIEGGSPTIKRLKHSNDGEFTPQEIKLVW